MNKTVKNFRDENISHRKDAVTERKHAAMEFLQMVVNGKIEEAYRKHVFIQGKHHNPFFSAGFPALQKAMVENHAQFPNTTLTVKHTLCDGDLVALHSHIQLRPGNQDVAAVHLFRFREDKIVEMWDCAQPIPADLPNTDGMF